MSQIGFFLVCSILIYVVNFFSTCIQSETCEVVKKEQVEKESKWTIQGKLRNKEVLI